MATSSNHRSYRLHISGLAPSVAAEEIIRRFSAFGKVVAVDGIGKLDANGHPLRYGFMQLETSETQLNRCMNLLSGTTYKGETMRIALAKPDYMARAAREKEESQTESVSQTNEENVPDKPQKAVSKSHRKLRKGVEGYESENWRLMTVKRFKNHDGTHGWRKDPATSLPIFPLITRPPRPLPQVVEGSSAVADPAVEVSQPKVINRARRIRIDPVLYRTTINGRNTHLVGPRAISIELYRLGHRASAKETQVRDIQRKIWECEYDDTGVAIWRLKHGKDVELEEKIQLALLTTLPPAPHESLESKKCEIPGIPVPSNQSLIPRAPLPPQPVPVPHMKRSALTDERQTYLNILRSLGTQSSSHELDSDLLQSLSVQGSSHHAKDGCVDELAVEDSFEVVGGDFKATTAAYTYQDETCDLRSTNPTSAVDGIVKINLSSELQLDTHVLRLKGGAAQPNKRKRKSARRSNSPTGSQSTREPLPTNPTEQISSFQDSHTGHTVRAISEEPTHVDTDLKAERHSYLLMAQQITSHPTAAADILEEVGQGSRQAVERQKLKEANRRGGLTGESEDEPFIEIVPQTDISPVVQGNMKQLPGEEETHLQSEVQLSSLSEMFRAKESDQIGFTLQGALAGMELELESPTISDDFKVQQSSTSDNLTTRTANGMDASVHPSRLALSKSVPVQIKSLQTGDKRRSLYFPLPVDEEPQYDILTSIANSLSTQGVPPCTFSVTAQGLPGRWRTFMRTETTSEIEARHNSGKAALTEQMRRKHKDSVKWAKKWGRT